MKVLLINGSPRGKGNTYLALSEAASALEAEGIQTEIVSIGAKAVQGCIACNKCAELGRCVFQDDLYNTVREKMMESAGLIIGSPTYYAGPNGSLCVRCSTAFFTPAGRICNTNRGLLWQFAAGEGRARRSTA